MSATETATETATPGGPSVAGATRDRLLRARRLDWRLLLPDPTPGTAAVVGDDDLELVAALAEGGWQVVEPSRAGVDLVVVVGPTAPRLASAARVARPGGWVHVTCGGALARLRGGRPGTGRGTLGPRSAARRLREAGLDSTIRWIGLPATAPRVLVPLDDPAPIAMLLRRRGGWAASRPVRGAAELARRMGLLAWLAPEVGLLARRPAPGAGSSPTFGRAGAPAASLDTTSLPLLLTPRFRASRNVVALLPGESPDRPALIAKVGRLPGASATAEREAAALSAVEAAGTRASEAAPRLVESGRRWGLPVIVETAVDGPLLDPGFVRRDPDGAIALGLDWLVALTREGPGSPAGERLDRLVVGPLSGLAAALPADDPLRDRAAATAETAGAIRDATIPRVIEHGDASHPNLIRATGGLAAVDWELGEPDGLPVHDLASFLAYIAVARAGAATPRAQGAAIVAALADDDGWAQVAGRTYAGRIGLDPALVEPLLAIAWARHLIGLVERIDDGTGNAVDRELSSWLGEHRYAAAWGAAIGRRTGGRA